MPKYWKTVILEQCNTGRMEYWNNGILGKTKRTEERRTGSGLYFFAHHSIFPMFPLFPVFQHSTIPMFLY
jgi:hypothetical protein